MKNRIVLQFGFFCITMVVFTASMDAQNIAPYVDSQGRFKVFDNGKIHDLEHEEVSEVQVGGDYVLYKDNIGQRKKYSYQETQVLSNAENIWYYPTQYLMAVVEGEEGGILKVIYGEEEELLSLDIDNGSFAVQDSILIFKDNSGDVNVFYKGEIHELPEAVKCIVSSNSVSFKDSSDVIHIFHEGEIVEVYNQPTKTHFENVFAPKMELGERDGFVNSAKSKNAKLFKEPKSTGLMLSRVFSAKDALLTDDGMRFRSKFLDYRNYLLTDPNEFLGKTKRNDKLKIFCLYSFEYHTGDNFVVFVDETGKLMCNDNGGLKEIVDFHPRVYRVGAKMVIFVDEFDALMVYWKGKVQKLTSSFPRFQALKNNTLTYVDDLGYFYVFDEGKKVSMEAYQPEYVAIDDGIVVYIDSDGRLQAYYEGKKLKVSSEIVKDFRLVGRVILYTIGNDETKIFHDGKHYWG
ncbi:MAG: hypothetical protein R3E32_12200 [Chitinophagales bacterium]